MLINNLNCPTNLSFEDLPDSYHDITDKTYKNENCYSLSYKVPFNFQLPPCSGIISSKLSKQNNQVLSINSDIVNPSIIIIDIRNYQNISEWADTLSVSRLFEELHNELQKNEKIQELQYYEEGTIVGVDFILSFCSSTNIREAYDYINKLVSSLELKVYKDILDLTYNELNIYNIS